MASCKSHYSDREHRAVVVRRQHGAIKDRRVCVVSRQGDLSLNPATHLRLARQQVGNQKSGLVQRRQDFICLGLGLG